MDERRGLPRWEIKKEAKLWLPQIQEFLHAIIEDIHLKGMCVSLDKPLPKQLPLMMSFAIGEGFDMIKLEAAVPWVKVEGGRHVYGLSFSNIADTEKDKIDQYINNNCFAQFKDKWWVQE